MYRRSDLSLRRQAIILSATINRSGNRHRVQKAPAPVGRDSPRYSRSLFVSYQKSAELLHQEAPSFAFDGTLIDEMSFQMLASEDSLSMGLTAKSAAKRTLCDANSNAIGIVVGSTGPALRHDIEPWRTFPEPAATSRIFREPISLSHRFGNVELVL